MNILHEIGQSLSLLHSQADQNIQDESILSTLENSLTQLAKTLSQNKELYYSLQLSEIFEMVLEIFHLSQRSLLSNPQLITSIPLQHPDLFTLKLRQAACQLIKLVLEKSDSLQESLPFSKEQFFQFIQVLAFSSRL
eukprot:TRINITY_DN34842_c0_g1_i1.p1 TRINITY_DN34842_c0_g1~~TRINITY_DN34842_c0_g1_i1.p1  ORF type:complete len:137 (+),score=14.89 TRINITY_DN34842_c0_g1_i1:2-412(+)